VDAQTENIVVQRLRERDPGAITEVTEFRGELTITLRRESLVRAAEYLRDAADLRFTFLSDVTGADRFPIEPRFELNYHLLSLDRREQVRLKLRVSGADAAAPSVTSVWPGANWHEREIFDLFGVRFDGHPDPRRILMPDDWQGHPLRKDYPTEGYR
jgi:NADH-quinone oxidoreductase subunit C